MTTTSELTARAQRVTVLLRTQGGRRIALKDLWAVLDRTDPTLAADVRRRAILAAVLTELAAASILTLPGERSYDRTEDPPLPLFVTLPAPDKPPSRRRQVVWHPALSWAPDTRLTPTQRDRLESVNRWLHTTRNPTPAPLRERSLEIFGNEKTLNRLLATSLFAPDRLSLELLATYRAVVRFTSEPVGTGNLLLVVENSDTFDSLARALRERTDHRVRLVAWGAGAAFEASVLSISRLHPPFIVVAYFGDLDEKGLRIPTNAAELAAREGLPAIRPAVGLYTALLQRARPQGGHRPLTSTTASELTAWLSPHHRAQASQLLTAGKRAAQEAVGRDYLTTHDDWLVDLR